MSDYDDDELPPICVNESDADGSVGAAMPDANEVARQRAAQAEREILILKLKTGYIDKEHEGDQDLYGDTAMTDLPDITLDNSQDACTPSPPLSALARLQVDDDYICDEALQKSEEVKQKLDLWIHKEVAEEWCTVYRVCTQYSPREGPRDGPRAGPRGPRDGPRAGPRGPRDGPRSLADQRARRERRRRRPTVSESWWSRVCAQLGVTSQSPAAAAAALQAAWGAGVGSGGSGECGGVGRGEWRLTLLRALGRALRDGRGADGRGADIPGTDGCGTDRCGTDGAETDRRGTDGAGTDEHETDGPTLLLETLRKMTPARATTPDTLRVLVSISKLQLLFKQ